MPQILLKKLQNLSSLKKAQPEPDQAGEETHETDGENDSEQSASKDVLEEKLKKSAMTRDLPNLARALAQNQCASCKFQTR